MDGLRLTLRAALAANRLEDFVRQEQARGVELDSGSEFERALALFLVQRSLREPTTRSRFGIFETETSGTDPGSARFMIRRPHSRCSSAMAKGPAARR